MLKKIWHFQLLVKAIVWYKLNASYLFEDSRPMSLQRSECDHKKKQFFDHLWVCSSVSQEREARLKVYHTFLLQNY